jgi:hypothetical protein
MSDEAHKTRAELELGFLAAIVAREAVIQAAGEHTKGQRRQGTLTPCPCCKKGRLDWSQAANGHMRGRCSEGCCAWVE